MRGLRRIQWILETKKGSQGRKTISIQFHQEHVIMNLDQDDALREENLGMAKDMSNGSEEGDGDKDSPASIINVGLRLKS